MKLKDFIHAYSDYLKSIRIPVECMTVENERGVDCGLRHIGWNFNIVDNPKNSRGISIKLISGFGVYDKKYQNRPVANIKICVKDYYILLQVSSTIKYTDVMVGLLELNFINTFAQMFMNGISEFCAHSFVYSIVNLDKPDALMRFLNIPESVYLQYSNGSDIERKMIYHTDIRHAFIDDLIKVSKRGSIEMQSIVLHIKHVYFNDEKEDISL